MDFIRPARLVYQDKPQQLALNQEHLRRDREELNQLAGVDSTRLETAAKEYVGAADEAMAQKKLDKHVAALWLYEQDALHLGPGREKMVTALGERIKTAEETYGISREGIDRRDEFEKLRLELGQEHVRKDESLSSLYTVAYELSELMKSCGAGPENYFEPFGLEVSNFGKSTVFKEFARGRIALDVQHSNEAPHAVEFIARIDKAKNRNDDITQILTEWETAVTDLRDARKNKGQGGDAIADAR